PNRMFISDTSSKKKKKVKSSTKTPPIKIYHFSFLLPSSAFASNPGNLRDQATTHHGGLDFEPTKTNPTGAVSPLIVAIRSNSTT
ncbi:hypothetical protein, partial [Salmonella enterica]|uniref:hypothetical protein n=1 Tax=Salmonella enterica TaxID=28901 RepID=UPI0032989634